MLQPIARKRPGPAPWYRRLPAAGVRAPAAVAMACRAAVTCSNSCSCCCAVRRSIHSRTTSATSVTRAARRSAALASSSPCGPRGGSRSCDQTTQFPAGVETGDEERRAGVRVDRLVGMAPAWADSARGRAVQGAHGQQALTACATSRLLASARRPARRVRGRQTRATSRAGQWVWRRLSPPGVATAQAAVGRVAAMVLSRTRSGPPTARPASRRPGGCRAGCCG